MTGTTTGNRKAERPKGRDYILWTLMALIAHAIGTAIFAVGAALVLSIPFRTMVLPYIALAYSGVVLGPLILWARLERERPKSCALRFTIAMFLYSQSIMLALGFGVIRLRILPVATVVNDYAPFLVFFFAICSVPAYFIARQILQPTK